MTTSRVKTLAAALKSEILRQPTSPHHRQSNASSAERRLRIADLTVTIAAGSVPANAVKLTTAAGQLTIAAMRLRIIRAGIACRLVRKASLLTAPAAETASTVWACVAVHRDANGATSSAAKIWP